MQHQEDVMASKPFFSKGLFDFLRDLKKNNRRDWFEKNKDRYEVFVKFPLLGFIGSFGPAMQTVSTSFVADTRPMGGSMFRIYRDTRFSKDKTPYKTHAAAQFRHHVGKDVHAPGFYLHLEPGGVFAGGGLWRPESTVAGQVRDAIAARGAEWDSIMADRVFKKTCSFEGEKLSRPPRGFSKTHPMIEWLKYKDFTFFAKFTEKEACSGGFVEKVAASFKAASPLMRFLTLAMGLDYGLPQGSQRKSEPWGKGAL
jgi:uncharacterized protein (TIGR02453 family)